MMKSQYPKIINGALIGIYVAFASLIIENDVSSLYLAIACFILIILITLFNNEFLENIQKIDINKFWSKPWIICCLIFLLIGNIIVSILIGHIIFPSKMYVNPITFYGTNKILFVTILLLCLNYSVILAIKLKIVLRLQRGVKILIR